MTTVLITTPGNLTKGESELWEWATGGMECALDDDDFMRDNPDMVTVEGQLEDMKYRIGTQSLDMAKQAATEYQQETAAIRVATSLLEKLENQ